MDSACVKRRSESVFDKSSDEEMQKMSKLELTLIMRIRYLLFLINNNHHHRHHYDRQKGNVVNLCQKSFVSFLLASDSNRYQYDSKAFLFSLVIKPGWEPVKLSQSGQYSSSRAHSIYFSSNYGPTFGGGHAFNIKNYASSNSNSFSDLGYTYSPPSGYSYTSTFARTFLAGTYKFTPDEVETFYETT